MRGLTLWRPWPWTIFHLPPGGAVAPKRLENRPMRPPGSICGGPAIALHAGKFWDDNCGPLCARLGVALPHRFSALPRAHPMDQIIDAHAEGAIIGLARVTGYVEGEPNGELRAFQGVSADRARELLADPWFFGPFAWVLSEVVTLAVPVPHRGAQGLWPVAAESAQAVLKQLA